MNAHRPSAVVEIPSSSGQSARTRRRMRRAVAAALESLESRRLLAVSTSLSGGTLNITGDAANNVLAVNREVNNVVARSGGSIIYSTAAANVLRVSMLGGFGNDSLAVNATLPATIRGG